MEKEEKNGTEQEVEVTTDVKTTKTMETPETTEAPGEGKTTDVEGEAPEAKDIDDVIVLLNIMDKETGGKGEITEIPDALRSSIKFLVDKLVFVRDLFEDPTWRAILDDMADQKEDGGIPSVEVAIARNIPLAKIQELAESEDYGGAQQKLSESLSAAKGAEEEDATYRANFEASQKAGDEYAKEMGYDEDEKNELFRVVLELFKIMGDGKLTVEEFRKVDKMRNYDKDTEGLRAQIGEKDAKEVLPDMASVETASTKAIAPKKAADGPGLGSMQAYMNPATDVTQVGKRMRGGR